MENARYSNNNNNNKRGLKFDTCTWNFMLTYFNHVHFMGGIFIKLNIFY